MVKRLHASELVSATWRCDGCAANGDGRNAQAVAAKHHDKTHHRTHVELTSRITYGAMFGKSKSGEQGGLFK